MEIDSNCTLEADYNTRYENIWKLKMLHKLFQEELTSEASLHSSRRFYRAWHCSYRNLFPMQFRYWSRAKVDRCRWHNSRLHVFWRMRFFVHFRGGTRENEVRSTHHFRTSVPISCSRRSEIKIWKSWSAYLQLFPESLQEDTTRRYHICSSQLHGREDSELGPMWDKIFGRANSRCVRRDDRGQRFGDAAS